MNATTLPLHTYLTALHAKHQALREGQVATYIPELAKADPEAFGIALVTTDGHAYAVGDADVPFTIQSMSKPAVYAAALADHGRSEVLRKVGVEPSGDAFNSISLDPQTGAPLNPMINAGAIATTGLVGGTTVEAQWTRIVAMVAALVGHEVDVDEAVYRSESATGFRNRAIAWLLRNAGIIASDPMPVLENYFRQCSLRVTCRDLATMAATLANGGVHPVNGERAVPAEEVPAVLSIMATCGMYDYAGSWLYEVGLPAKSGVSGGIFAVMPGRFGIAVFSPPLDAHGNSVRGVAVCRDISRDFALHVFAAPASPSLVLAGEWSAADAPSRRVRTPTVAARLRAAAPRIRCLALQGEVAFDGAEYVVRRLVAQAPEVSSFVLDLHRASFVSESAARLLHDARRLLMADGKAVVFSRIRGRPGIEEALRRTLMPDDRGYLSFEDNDVAIEWCENRLLASEPADASAPRRLAEFSLFAGTGASALARLASLMESVDYPAGATIIAAGDDADDRVFLIRDGEVSVVLDLADGSHQRVATLSGGMCFGELALLGQGARSAYVHADTTVHGWAFRAAALDRVAEDCPDLKISVLTNLSRDLAERLRQANRLIGVLAA